MAGVIHKKRELIADWNNLIAQMVEISGDIAKLELFDNFEASKRVRARLVDLRRTGLPDFEEKIKSIRVEIKRKSSVVVSGSISIGAE